MEDPDADLMQRFVLKGDREALGRLFALHAPGAYRTARLIVRDPGAAEDAVQEAFSRLLSKAGAYDPARPFLPWLRSLVAHAALDRMKSDQRRAVRESQIRVEKTSEDPAMRLIAAETRVKVKEEIDRLPEELRLPVALHYQAGYSYAETAEALGCPEGTVATRLASARERLKGALAMAGIVLAISLEDAAAASAPAVEPVPPTLSAALQALAASAPLPAPSARVPAAKPLALVTASLLVAGGGFLGWKAAQDPEGDPPAPRAGKPARTTPLKKQDLPSPELQKAILPSPPSQPKAGSPSDPAVSELTGRVICKETGRPIEGARVFLRPETTPQPPARSETASGETAYVELSAASEWPKAEEALTDAEGRFRFPAPSAPATLSAAAKGFCGMNPFSCPKVDAGETEHLELALSQGKGLILRLRTSDGNLPDPACLRLESSGGIWLSALESPKRILADGSLDVGEIDLETFPPDETTLTLWAPGYLPYKTSLGSLPRSGDRFVVDAALEAGRTIRGVLLGSDGLPVPGKASILGWPEGPFARSGARILTSKGNLQAPGIQEVPVGSDGAFLLQGFPTDKAVHLWAQGGTEAMNETKILEPGPAEAYVTLRCDAAGEIAGRVLDPDGRPVPGASVAISAGDKDWSFMQRTMTDADGQYRLKGLPSGQGLHLEAWKSGFNNFAWREVPLGIGNADLVLEPGKKDMVVKPWPKP